MSQHLTDLILRQLTAQGEQRREVWDGKVPGFGVRITA